MRKAGFLLLLSVPFFVLLFISFVDSFTYHTEIKRAYGYIDPVSQKSIKNANLAQVREEKVSEDTKIMDEMIRTLINIKGKEVLIISFKTKDEGSLGPISVYLDKKTGEAIGMGMRK
ncbi:hypothetical protein DRW41_08720 [Neobacillus piezotolerans]|uniref:Uncharacterized protein n=1 Tax=Neobacillus piezotolerans TaxID=2259171 RepID=A0A3D8GU17_9BACI|nr:hypothetical protein [Neobacillus piezotolerans]RDU37887.1 hypothetical protein DRW41_08720 [Neobacillus piezotolerans]